MAGKPLEQRVAEADERIRRLQAQKQALAQQLRHQERKERTRRLIQVGAVMAKLGVDSLEKAQQLQHEIERRSEAREGLSRVVQRDTDRQQAKDYVNGNVSARRAETDQVVMNGRNQENALHGARAGHFRTSRLEQYA